MSPPYKVQTIVDMARHHNDQHSTDFSDVYKGIVQLQHQDKNPAKFQADMATLNTKLHAQGILSDFQLTGVDNANHLIGIRGGQQLDMVAANTSDVFKPGTAKHSWWQGVENVVSTAGKGALNEVTHHFDHIVESAALGVAVGTAAVFAPPILATVAGVAGIGYLGYELYEHVPGWTHDAKVVADPQKYSNKEFRVADQGVQAFGAGAADVTAGVAGTFAGGYLGSAIKTGLASRAAAAAQAQAEGAEGADVPGGTGGDTASHAHMQHGNVASGAGQIGDPTQGSSTPTDGGASLNAHHHLSGAIAGGDPTGGSEDGATLTAKAAGIGDSPIAPKAAAAGSGDGAAAVAPKETVVAKGTDAQPAVAAVKALTPQEVQIQQSIATNQGLFHEAASDGSGIITAQKQSYNVMFKKITEPGVIQTLENRAGEPVTPGQWVAVRLQPSGEPVLEDGIVNQWPVTAKTILKSYQATPEQLETANQLIAATKTDGPAVHMIQIEGPFKIETPWGSMSGGKGDWLANYDYDPAAKIPGKSYAIITKTSFGQTYQKTP